jgi:hypothetical protein
MWAVPPQRISMPSRESGEYSRRMGDGVPDFSDGQGERKHFGILGSWGLAHAGWRRWGPNSWQPRSVGARSGVSSAFPIQLQGVLDDLFGEVEFAGAEFFLGQRAGGDFFEQAVEVDALGLHVLIELAAGFAVEGGEDDGVFVVSAEEVVASEQEQVVAEDGGDVVGNAFVASFGPALLDARGEGFREADLAAEASELRASCARGAGVGGSRNAPRAAWMSTPLRSPPSR